VQKYNPYHTGISTMKEWKSPELTVLVRSKPEEAVLTACKFTWAGYGDDSAHTTCARTYACNICLAFNTS